MTLPGPVLLQEGVRRMFHGRVENLLDVAETLDDMVVDEELLVPADVKEARRFRRRRSRQDKPCRQDARGGPPAGLGTGPGSAQLTIRLYEASLLHYSTSLHQPMDV